MKYICHFSCGCTSAIATAIALRKYKDVEIIYADTGSEHPDNRRFLHDCEEKLFMGKKVKIVKHEKFKNIFEVFEDRRFLASPYGAPCTLEMKKLTIRKHLGNDLYDAVQVMGFDAAESDRINRYRDNNPELTLYLPLIDYQLTKGNCLALLMRLGVEMPKMYRMGYESSNCIGCVKAENHRYWAAIRKDFPDVFKWYSEFERKIGRKGPDGKPIGAAINKREERRKGQKIKRFRVFLDELPDNIKPMRNVEIACGYSCGKVADMIEKNDVSDLDEEKMEDVFHWMTA